jgi:CBS domain-containing protein
MAVTTLAGDAMATDLLTVMPTTPIGAALEIMKTRDVRHLLVLDGQELAGVLSNRDYRRVLDRADEAGTIRGVHDIVVREIMTPAVQVISARPDTPLLNIAQLMVMKKVGCIPVLDNHKRPIGILTQKDVMEHLTRPRLPSTI